MRRQDAVADAAGAHRGRAQDGPDSIRLAFIAISAYGAAQESARQSLCAQAHGGKSGLHRARCQVTPGGREPTESATERYRLSAAQAVPVRVKWCGKSAPRWWQHQRHGKPHLEQDQIGKHAVPLAAHVAHMRLPGRSLELRGDAHPRGMTVQDRTRLNGRLFSSADAPFLVLTHPIHEVRTPRPVAARFASVKNQIAGILRR
jgi:hypothetical protein